MNFLYAVFLVWVTGFSVIILLPGRKKYAFTLGEFLSLSLFTGISAVVFFMFFYSFAGIRYEPSQLLIIPAFFMGLAAIKVVLVPTGIEGLVVHRDPGITWSRIEKFFFLVILVQILYVILVTVPFPVRSHDAIANYAFKARIFFDHGGIPSGFFSWPHMTVAHPDYPLMLSLWMTWIYGFTGYDNTIVTLIMPIFYVGFLTLFFALSRKLFSSRYALLLTFIMGTIPQVGDYATIIHADLLLAGFVTIGVLYLLSYIRNKNSFELVLASIIMGSSLWIKNEAMAFTAVFFIVLIVLLKKSPAVERKVIMTDMLRSGLIISFIGIPWFIVRASSGVVNADLDIASLTIARVLENVKDIPMILYIFQKEVFGPKKWNILWIIFFASMIWKRKKLSESEVFYLLLFIALSSGAYFTAYMAMTGENLFFYVNTTMSRFLIHFSGMAVIMSGYLLRDEVKQFLEQDR